MIPTDLIYQRGMRGLEIIGLVTAIILYAILVIVPGIIYDFIFDIGHH